MRPNLKNIQSRLKRLVLERDRDVPTLFHSMRVDPTIPMDPEIRHALVDDMERWSRRFVYPLLRVGCRIGIHAALAGKRILPFEVASQPLLSKLSVWFLDNCVSPEAQLFALRHFAIESALINFVAKNVGANDVFSCELAPRRVAELGQRGKLNTIVLHDVNVFNLFIDLGHSDNADIYTQRLPETLDFSSLELPDFDIDWNRRRLIALDFQSAVSITALFIVLLLDQKTAERAINSFQLDEGLLGIVANLTGDPTFRTWTPLKFQMWLGMPTGDPARDLHYHILVHENAFHRLKALAASVQNRANERERARMA